MNFWPSNCGTVQEMKEYLLSLENGGTLWETDYGFDFTFPWLAHPLVFVTREYRVEMWYCGKEHLTVRYRPLDGWVVPKCGVFSFWYIGFTICYSVLGVVYPYAFPATEFKNARE